MSDKLLAQISKYVSDNIGKFHAARSESLSRSSKRPFSCYRGIKAA